jgi:hypothetical protein
MAKRVPIDCKRIKPDHLKGLSRDQLLEIAQRIEIQAQHLNRVRRLVDRAVVEGNRI